MVRRSNARTRPDSNREGRRQLGPTEVEFPVGSGKIIDLGAYKTGRMVVVSREGEWKNLELVANVDPGRTFENGVLKLIECSGLIRGLPKTQRK